MLCKSNISLLKLVMFGKCVKILSNDPVIGSSDTTEREGKRVVFGELSRSFFKTRPPFKDKIL
jgi:hypothetical protein